MGIQWIEYVRKDYKLTVFNKAAAWAGPVQKALDEFNKLNLGVKLEFTTEEKKARIIVALATGPDKIDFVDRHFEGSVPTKSSFDPKKFHGYCGTLRDPVTNVIVFAGIFLPGSVEATDEQKMVVVLHEFMHACGLNGMMSDGKQHPNQDHDLEGIMAGQMVPSGKGLIEFMPKKGVKAMPPIRISGKTQGAARLLWAKPKKSP